MSERKRILVAESEELDLEFFEVMFNKLGFVMERAGDGQAALDKMKQKRIDLALVNTILPRLSGWEVLKRIKEDPALDFVQVILLSDIGNAREKVEAYTLGAEDYIVKPFSFPVLLAKIQQSLRAKDFYIELGKQLAEKKL